MGQALPRGRGRLAAGVGLCRAVLRVCARHSQDDLHHGCVGQEVGRNFSLSLVPFFCSALRSHSSIPARTIVQPPRAAAVKAGRVFAATRRAWP